MIFKKKRVLFSKFFFYNLVGTFMLNKKLKTSLLLAAALCSFETLGAGFKIPAHYVLEFVDGDTNPSNYSSFTKTIELTPGRHQVVVSFKDSFSAGAGDRRIVQSVSPLVIDIYNIGKDDVYSFTHRTLTSFEDAQRFANEQKIELVNTSTDKPLTPQDASYFLMTSDRGFSMMREYKNELASLGRLYAPNDVPGSQRGLSTNAYGTPTIRADSSGSVMVQQGLTLEPMGGGSAMSTSSTSKGGKVNHVTYNELVKMYNSADDATKLKFVKYVMSR